MCFDRKATRMPRRSGKGGDDAVWIVAAKGLLQIVQRLLAADFLQRHHIGIEPIDHLGKQLQFTLKPLLFHRRRPRRRAKEILDVPRHGFEHGHRISLRVGWLCRMSEEINIME
jgi:hypothetical protein